MGPELMVAAAAGASSSAVLAVTWWSRRPHRAPGPRQRGRTEWEAAFLAGGPYRVADAAIAALHEDGRLSIGGPGVVSLHRAASADPVAAAVARVVREVPDGSLARVRHGVAATRAVAEIGDRLVAGGLLRRPRGQRWALPLAAAHLMLWLVFGASLLALTVAGRLDDWADGYGTPFVAHALPYLLPSVAVGWACRRGQGVRLSPAGEKALAGHRARLGTGPVQAAPTALLVALRGSDALPDPVTRAQFAAARCVPGHLVTGRGTGTTWCGATLGGRTPDGWDSAGQAPGRAAADGTPPGRALPVGTHWGPSPNGSWWTDGPPEGGGAPSSCGCSFSCGG
ncbi:TIGR04222 domain-containing membrane protein [Streptomyces sp. NPDC059740]|uniref:TIGR04222 domain-containing membrane protein n=1 Tax=Streptomyces sp. NPDC059740 TaxID=3346926 RepID=UPI0036573A5E